MNYGVSIGALRVMVIVVEMETVTRVQNLNKAVCILQISFEKVCQQPFSHHLAIGK